MTNISHWLLISTNQFLSDDAGIFHLGDKQLLSRWAVHQRDDAGIVNLGDKQALGRWAVHQREDADIFHWATSRNSVGGPYTSVMIQLGFFHLVISTYSVGGPYTSVMMQVSFIGW